MPSTGSPTQWTLPPRPPLAGGRWRGGRRRGICRRKGLLRSASRCQGSWCLHFARSRDAQQLLKVRRQQDLQLCAIIRMSADIVGGIMYFELFFDGILKTGGSLEQPVLGGLVGCRHENVSLIFTIVLKEIRMSPSPKSFGREGP